MSQSLTISVVSWFLGAISVIFVATRIFTRVVLTKNVGWDDGFIILSLVRMILSMLESIINC